MNNNYIIPANSKKSQLILGFFTGTDFILFSSGVTVTLILLLLVKSTDIVIMLLILMPALVIINIVTYFTNRRAYIWRGWCLDGEDE